MPKNTQTTQDVNGTVDLLKKSLMLELFKLGVSQEDIGKKLKTQKVTVNAFLRGVKKPQ
jgi:hypothetical protein